MTFLLPAFKRGDTFGITCQFLENGEPQDITDIDIKCQIREATILVTELLVTKADQVINKGIFLLRPTDPDTKLWSLGSLICDIQFTHGGIVRSTETFRVQIIEQVTI